MDKIIALCITVVLTIGLIGYAIVTAQRQYSYTSDSIGMFNRDINMRLQDEDIIGKDEALRYIRNRNILEYDLRYVGKGKTATLKHNDNTIWAEYDLKAVLNDLDKLTSMAMFRVNQIKDTDGKVSKIVLEFIEKS